ncbi:tumor necrosis factor receptor superfamily member wengen isoform X2 [Agrilus planipennis]|uniref:Tumor necrosis factor receptor superfamily member wengen isoform X2 n=1 Tax=Agrilus planipennis TaxID=224129 RepID=A0A1W4XFV6_AGRPL|nr:tumor necrosis factor receptor superfamily member wengen isoform X2 [Agrilus planipennis]
MGNVKGLKVMFFGLTVCLFVVFPCLARSLICPQGKQFLDTERQRCANCTICDHAKGLVVLRPCEVHRDTICGTINELTLDWSLYPGAPEQTHHNRHNHHRHHHEQRILWNFDDDDRAGKTVDTKNKRIDEKVSFETDVVTSTEMAFSSAETLVWDWQAIALTLAIFSCILFFLVIALYSLHQAKQWRRLKENFEAVRKDTKIISDKKGNVYIEEANPGGKT